MMDACGELSVSGEAEYEQSLAEEMWGTTAVENKTMDLR
jgi:hypothetical protein